MVTLRRTPGGSQAQERSRLRCRRIRSDETERANAADNWIKLSPDGQIGIRHEIFADAERGDRFYFGPIPILR